MDKAIFLQKQVRENSEDLQKELRDMVAWEEEMKRKDVEIRNSKEEQGQLPPVRSKKKKIAEPAPSKESVADKEQTQMEKPANSDNASEKVEEKKEGKIVEMPTEEELEKDHNNAIIFKDEGNALVQKKEYAKAVGKYNQAIKIFPYDAVFYANRALCQLKLDNLHSADADCTKALQLDERYVKAYHRRAMARMELKRYDDAKNDFEKVLELEPSNKDAALKLKQIKEKLSKKSSTMIIAGEENRNNSIERSIGEKLFGKKSTGDKKETSKLDKNNKNQNAKVNEPQTGTSKGKLLIEEITEETSSSVVKTSSDKKKNLSNNDSNSEKESSGAQKTEGDELPPWLPKLKEGLSIIQPVKEVSRQSKKSLTRIEIKEISENESIFDGIIEEKLVKEKNVEESNVSKSVKNETKSYSEYNNRSNVGKITNLPPPPKTSVSFFMNWQRNPSDDFRYEYLKQIVPNHLPGIIKASMESDIFSGIISILNIKFVPNGDKVYDWLYYLSKLERFKALILFMTQADKEALKSLLEFCKTKEGKTDDELNGLYAAYEL